MTDAPRRTVFGAMCTFDRPHELHRSLDVLAEQTRSLDALVIVDNASDPSIPALVAAHALATQIPIEVIDAGENLGPAGGYAAAYSRIDELADDDDLVLILDDDDPPPAEFVLEDLIAAAETAFTSSKVAGIGLRGGQLDLQTGVIDPRPTSATTQTADHLHGGWLPLYRVEALRTTEVFDDGLFWGFDDLELGRRLIRAGWEIRVAGEVFCRLSQPNVKTRSRDLAPRSWRHYFRHRNLLRILIRDRAWGAVVSVIALRLVAKPLYNAFRTPRLAWWHLRTNLHAAFDALSANARFEQRHRPAAPQH